MKHLRFISISILLIFIAIACSGDLIQNSEEISSTSIPDSIATIAFERTAIAQFTENQAVAASLTPFYGSILWNEAIRQVTATPVFDPERECYLVADFWKMTNLEENIETGLQENDIPALTEAFVSVVWDSQNCGEYLVVSNRIRVWIDADNADNPIEVDSFALETVINRVSSEIMSEIDLSPDLSTIEVRIFADSTELLSTNLHEISEALTSNLSSSEFIEALGGINSP